MQSIVIVGRRWRDRNSNTEQTAEIFIDGRQVGGTAIGYKDFAEAAFDWLAANNHIQRQEREHYRKWAERTGVIVGVVCSNVAKRGDL